MYGKVPQCNANIRTCCTNYKNLYKILQLKLAISRGTNVTTYANKDEEDDDVDHNDAFNQQPAQQYFYFTYMSIHSFKYVYKFTRQYNV